MKRREWLAGLGAAGLGWAQGSAEAAGSAIEIWRLSALAEEAAAPGGGPSYMLHAQVRRTAGGQSSFVVVTHLPTHRSTTASAVTGPEASGILRPSQTGWRLVWPGPLAPAGSELGLDLRVTASQAPLPHGRGGRVSHRDSPLPPFQMRSHPQGSLSGSLRLDGRPLKLQGRTWLDHEQHRHPLPQTLGGQDRICMNYQDGSALTAWQWRERAGAVEPRQPARAAGLVLSDGGVFRTGRGERFDFKRGEVIFSRQKVWRSPVTHAVYPVEWIVRTPADFYTVTAQHPQHEVVVQPLEAMWLGPAEMRDSNGLPVATGHLQMQGYGSLRSV